MASEALASAGTKSWLYHPVFPDHWERRGLYSLAQWVNGLAFRDIQFSPTGKPVIKIAEIKGGISGQTKFTEQLFEESVHVRAGDLLFSWSGQPETSIDVFWWRGSDGWLNQHSFRVTPVEGVDPTFFYYLLKYLKPSFVGIARNKQTTGLGHVTKRDLENIEAACPPLSEQRAIAHVLGTLDDKIELNRRMSETLEAMARALFKSWFVDFGPVRAKAESRDPGLPKSIADAFPDRFQESELGQIPTGWSIGKLGDFLTAIETGGRPKGGVKEIASGVPSVGAESIVGLGRFDYSKTKFVPVEFFQAMTKGHVRDGDVLLYKDGGRPGEFEPHVTMVGEGFPFDTFCINEHVYRLRTDPGVPQEYLYFWLSSDRAMDEMRNRGTGVAIPGLNSTAVRQLAVVLPGEQTLARFHGEVGKLVRRLLANCNQARTLAAMRDAMLPRLISGELHLEDVERFIGRSV